MTDRQSDRDGQQKQVGPPDLASEPGFALDGLSPSRRSFLKLAGFSFATALLGGCSRSEETAAIPFLERPEAITPGVTNWYATLCAGCTAGCGIHAKNRDGRPIKIEGNPDDPLSGGGVCAVGQAGVLGLYDSKRLKQPLVKGAPVPWATADEAIRARLDSIRERGGAVRVLTGTVNGPTQRGAIDRFLARFRDGRHVMYDPVSASAILDAHDETHGRRVLPHYRFDLADVIVSFDADFLGTWIAPVEFTRAYQAGRGLDVGAVRFSHHVQLESRLSLTGCNADRRVPVAPDDLGPALVDLAAAVAKRAGVAPPWGAAPRSGVEAAVVEAIADRLRAAPRGRTLVVCGSNDVAMQRVTNYVNHLLGNYGVSGGEPTVDTIHPSRQRLGSDNDLAGLLAEIEEGRVAALVVAGCNPVYDLPTGADLAKRLGTLELCVSLAERVDETAAAAGFVCPDHHFLESWNDAEPVAGHAVVSQPVVHPLGRTRALAESLAVWSGAPKSAYDLIRETWRETVFPRQDAVEGFEAFWNQSVHDGQALLSVEEVPAAPFRADALARLAARPKRLEGTLGLDLYAKVSLPSGQHAHNPWLQELPDPVTKVAWDNYACLAPTTAKALGVANSDVVRLSLAGSDDTDGAGIELPVLVQVGQHEGAVAVALGYGRRGTDRFANVGPEWLESHPTVAPGSLVGVNAAALVAFEDGHRRYRGRAVTVRPTGRRHVLALAQIYGSLEIPPALAAHAGEKRAMVQSTSLDAYRENPAAGTHRHHVHELWSDDHPYEGHHWALAIDLAACTGCSACVIACQAENNIPVVGKDEVRRTRLMHWLRIDRYHWGQGGDFEVAHQPMMCQQCDNAPCETVCPVLATVHSSEGLNQQVYNRCVGTRYCSNNCPYKVRRFNWFDYARDDKLENVALNPDVTVRSRGVMEKCTFCVQRIEEARARALAEERPLADGEIQTACMQSCPAGAIVFGDRNDAASRVAQQLESPRTYRVLEELNVRPSVGYLTRIRDRQAGEDEVKHG